MLEDARVTSAQIKWDQLKEIQPTPLVFVDPKKSMIKGEVVMKRLYILLARVQFQRSVIAMFSQLVHELETNAGTYESDVVRELAPLKCFVVFHAVVFATFPEMTYGGKLGRDQVYTPGVKRDLVKAWERDLDDYIGVAENALYDMGNKYIFNKYCSTESKWCELSDYY